MAYDSNEVDNKATGDPSGGILTGKDIPISLTANDDPNAATAALKSARKKGEHRPVDVKAQINIQILDRSLDKYEKTLTFEYAAFKRASDGKSHTKTNDAFTADADPKVPINQLMWTIPAYSNQAYMMVIMNAPGSTGTYYAAIHVEVKTPDGSVGNDEILVRFDKP
jgi:hypothetical protein